MGKLIKLERLSKEKFDGHLAEGTLRNWCSSGQIPFVRIGGRIFFDEDEIESWISEHRAQSHLLRLHRAENDTSDKAHEFISA
jgi:hypothetical protein